MGEYYAVYQSGAELLGVGMTIADALRDAELWSDRVLSALTAYGLDGRAGKRAGPLISAPVPRNSMRPCMRWVGASHMRSMMRGISRCSTRARPNPSGARRRPLRVRVPGTRGRARGQSPSCI
jgi:hypothetical protein